MKIKIFGFLFLVVAPLLVSCTSNSNADTPLPTVSYSVIASGASTINNLPVNRKLEIYTDQASFNSSLYLFIQPLAEHTVDFSSRRVALLSLGLRPTGGYSISAEKIEDFGEFIKASIVIKKPGSNCVVTQALTSPYQFIEVESVKELLFEERVEVVNCT
jgi:PrcB C-terminal